MYRHCTICRAFSLLLLHANIFLIHIISIHIGHTARQRGRTERTFHRFFGNETDDLLPAHEGQTLRQMVCA